MFCVVEIRFVNSGDNKQRCFVLSKDVLLIQEIFDNGILCSTDDFVRQEMRIESFYLWFRRSFSLWFLDRSVALKGQVWFGTERMLEIDRRRSVFIQQAVRAGLPSTYAQRTRDLCATAVSQPGSGACRITGYVCATPTWPVRKLSINQEAVRAGLRRSCAQGPRDLCATAVGQWGSSGRSVTGGTCAQRPRKKGGGRRNAHVRREERVSLGIGRRESRPNEI